MEQMSKALTRPVKRPIKVIQFGEGNFLRGFVDYMLDVANEKGLFDGNIAVVKPIPFGNLDLFKKQDCQYTLQLRGRVQGEPVVKTRQITCIETALDCYSQYREYMDLAKEDSLRFVVSNTTEAGIVFDPNDKMTNTPPDSYPGKLTQFLYERFKAFSGNQEKGLIILPVELIDDNGIELKRCVMKYIELWGLGKDFYEWIEEACIFTSTLVDRIITGYPRDEVNEIWEDLGYKDELINTGEPFALWVIESEKSIKEELPLDVAGLPVIFTNDQKPYKQRKVRILNGAHTSFVLAAYLAGKNYVAESMQDETIRKFMNDTIHEEVIPTLSLPKQDLEEFADAVVDRFDNPFIKHSLLAISLNSVSKWKARCMPSFLGYIETKKELPPHLTFSIAALMEFYSGIEMGEGFLIGKREDETYEIKDDKEVLTFFLEKSKLEIKEFVKSFLGNSDFHGRNLNEIPGLTEQVTQYLQEIRELGMKDAISKNFPA